MQHVQQRLLSSVQCQRKHEFHIFARWIHGAIETCHLCRSGATINQIEPDPGNDGIAFVGSKVTNPSAGVWHYEYALYNQNLDRSIQSFRVPLATANISNIGFHAPPQEPGWANDGTFNNQGYSSMPWAGTQ